jgi:hypothetical protein
LITPGYATLLMAISRFMRPRIAADVASMSNPKASRFTASPLCSAG